jgi:hypothetical protein
MLRIVLLAALIAVPAIARRPAPPPDLGTLTLDRADPAIDATVAGIPARLAVALDARDTIELAPSFVARPDLLWQPDNSEEIGRVSLPSRMAAGEVALGGVVTPTKLTTHDRPCCAGHDGELGPLHMPWSIVRIGAGGGVEKRWPAAFDEQSGLHIPWRTPAGTIRLILSPRAGETIATASAAAILAKAYGAHFTGEGRSAPIAFGISRQVRDMVLDSPAPLLGFTIQRIAVRYADFAGGRTLPRDAPDEGIIVRHRGPASQHDWPAIAIGRDLLDRCPAIAVYRAGADGGPEIGLSCSG